MRSSMCAAFSVTPRATVTVYGFSGETSDSFSAKVFRASATSAGVSPPRLGLEQQVDGALAGLVPAAIASTIRHSPGPDSYRRGSRP